MLPNPPMHDAADDKSSDGTDGGAGPSGTLARTKPAALGSKQEATMAPALPRNSVG